MLDSGLNFSDHCAICFCIRLPAADSRQTPPVHAKTPHVEHAHSVPKYTWNDINIHNFQNAIA